MTPPLIVLIEDNPGDVLLVEIALKEAGIIHQMVRFESASDAAKKLCDPAAREAIRPDAILMDLNTPRSNGFEILGKLTTSPSLSAVPIAVLTSSRARSDRKRVELHGVRYIEKPSQLQEFLSAVGNAVAEMLARRGGASG